MVPFCRFFFVFFLQSLSLQKWVTLNEQKHIFSHRMFLKISFITIPIGLPVRMAAVEADPHQCKHNPAVSVIGLPWWALRQSLHQHPAVADTAFAHIISSQQSQALSTNISTVMMEIHSWQNTGWLWACVLHLCGDIRAICFHNTEGTFSLGLKSTSIGVIDGDAESKVEYRLLSQC